MIQIYNKGMMIALAAIFMVIPIVFTALRVWAKLISRKKVAVDDCLAFAALIVCVGCCVAQIVAAQHGRLGQHQLLLPDGSPDTEDPGFIVYEKAKFAVNCLTILGLGLIKASILHFYKSIFTIRPFRLAVNVMLGIVWFWTASFFFANLFTCYPITPLVDLYFGSPHCMKAIPMWLSAVVTDVVLDFAILFMPTPMVLRLKLPLKQRIGILGIFLLGASVCAASITRTYTYFYIAFRLKQYNDLTYYTSPVFFWAVIEQSLAVVSAALPTLRPLWLHFFPKNKLGTQRSGKYSGLSGDALKGSSKPSNHVHAIEHHELQRRDSNKELRRQAFGGLTPSRLPHVERQTSLEGLITKNNGEATTATRIGVEGPQRGAMSENSIVVTTRMEAQYSSR